MLSNFSLLAGLLLAGAVPAIAQWKPMGDNLKTTWGEHLDPANVWPQYPRPALRRRDWQNLNGFWDYAIRPRDQPQPAAYDGKILVPFCPESSLSGVQKPVTENDTLWYHRRFTIPKAWAGKRVQLNFGAIDWKAEIYLNGALAGSHTGGYAPFSVDMTPYLKGDGAQDLVVKVFDPTDTSYEPVGKQRLHPSLIWYTAVSGIWQTVWMEPVPEQNIQAICGVADIDHNALAVNVTESGGGSDPVVVEVMDGSTPVARGTGTAGQGVVLSIPSAKLWDPVHPFLYGIEAALYHDGRPVDHAASYTAMRKISTHRDSDGFVRIQLNNRDIFPLGPLDQGWWPDGLYTPPSQEAMLYDLQKTKQWGFNMIRKHMKVEPALWYAACDRMGFLVWQDMPAGDAYPKWEPFKLNGGEEVKRSPESAAEYRKEWKEIIDALRPYPCVAVWTPFNESWGQFDTIEIANWTKSYDPSRLVDPASGGNHRPCGDMVDIHHYPDPKLSVFDPDRANIIGEFGGILLTNRDHLWKASPKNYWDKHKYSGGEEVTRDYVKYIGMLKDLIPKGLCAGVYTQTTDVEVEVNGIMTYDRKVVKMDEAAVRKANDAVTHWHGGP